MEVDQKASIQVARRERRRKDDRVDVCDGILLRDPVREMWCGDYCSLDLTTASTLFGALHYWRTYYIYIYTYALCVDCVETVSSSTRLDWFCKRQVRRYALTSCAVCYCVIVIVEVLSSDITGHRTNESLG